MKQFLVVVLLFLVSPAQAQHGFSGGGFRGSGFSGVRGSSGSGGHSSSAIEPMLLIAPFALVCMGLVALAMRKTTTSTVEIRIRDVPPGEAPEKIRRAWVGLTLPLAPGKQPQLISAEGTMTKSRVGACRGYMVDGATALAILEKHAPEAAVWWRENARHVGQSGYKLDLSRRVVRELATQRNLLTANGCFDTLSDNGVRDAARPRERPSLSEFELCVFRLIEASGTARF